MIITELPLEKIILIIIIFVCLGLVGGVTGYLIIMKSVIA